MFRGVVSILQNNLDLVLAKILIKERENSAQFADCGIDYFEGGLCYPVYGGQTDFSSKKWLRSTEKEKQLNLKEDQIL